MLKEIGKEKKWIITFSNGYCGCDCEEEYEEYIEDCGYDIEESEEE